MTYKDLITKIYDGKNGNLENIITLDIFAEEKSIPNWPENLFLKDAFETPYIKINLGIMYSLDYFDATYKIMTII